MQTKGHSNQSLHWTHQFAEEDRVKTPYFLDESQPQCNPKDLSLSMLLPDRILGSRDGAVVRALAFHQCDPGSIPGLDVICGLSLLLVLFSAPRGFSPGTVQYRKWSPTANDPETANDPQSGPQMILDRKWSPKSTANDPERKIGMAWTQVSGSSCRLYYYYNESD